MDQRRLQILEELERRGSLPQRFVAPLAEARKRGLLGGSNQQPTQAAPSSATTPAAREHNNSTNVSNGAVLSAGPEPTTFQRLIDGLQESGLVPRGQANQVRQNSGAVGAALRAAPREATFGLTNFAEAGLDAVNPAGNNFGEFSQALDQVRNRNETDRQRHPNATALGGVAGGILGGGAALKAGVTASRAIPQGVSGLRDALARGGAAAADGAVIGGTQALSEGNNVASGALLGAATAGGLQGGAEALTGAAGGIAKRIQQAGLSPQQKVNENIARQVNQQGGREAVQQQLNELGPDAVLADVLQSGPRALKKAGNLSPDAQQITQQRLTARQAGQNGRLIDDLNDTVGLNGTQTVEDLQGSIRDRFKPRVNQRFEAAREAGAELPREPFRDILQTPNGGRAFKRAQTSVQNDIPIRGQNADSDLSILDETIRTLRDRGQSLTQSGQRNEGARNFGLAGELRTRVDDALSGGEFKAARALRQRQGQREDAVQAGADLSVRPNRQNLQNVQNLDPRFQSNAQQGFVADLTDRIAQQRNNAGARQRLDSPAGKQTIESLFNPQQQQRINQSFDRENTFASTLSQQGGSQTAQNLSDIENSSLLGDAISAGSNLASGGISGAVRSAGNALLGSTIARGQRRNAPFTAQTLTANQIPESVTKQLTPQQLRAREEIIKLLSRTGAANAN